MRILVALLLTVCLVQAAHAELFTQTLTWSDNLITQATPFAYEHNILYATPPVHVLAGDRVANAELTLSFGDDDPGDLVEKLISNGLTILDETESVLYGFDGWGWRHLAQGQEIDTGSFSLLVNASLLNDDGILGVRIKVYNSNGTGDVYLTSSTLTGEFVPVPAAVVLGMLGLGVAGLRLRRFA
jgi:hypothetical protein